MQFPYFIPQLKCPFKFLVPFLIDSYINLFFTDHRKIISKFPSHSITGYFIYDLILLYKLLLKWDGHLEIVNQVDSVTYRVRRNLDRKLQIMTVYVPDMPKLKVALLVKRG